MSDKPGYGNPPKHSQFKKGVSGNPKGRPRQNGRELGDVIIRAQTALVRYRELGRPKKGSRLEVLLKKLVNQAVEGDVRSADRLFKLRLRAGNDIETGVQKVIVEGWLRDYRGQTGIQKTLEHAEDAKAQSRDFWDEGDLPTTDLAKPVASTE
jgi:hypothetical protein